MDIHGEKQKYNLEQDSQKREFIL